MCRHDEGSRDRVGDCHDDSENMPEALRNIKSVIARFDPKFTYEPVFLEDA